MGASISCPHVSRDDAYAAVAVSIEGGEVRHALHPGTWDVQFARDLPPLAGTAAAAASYRQTVRPPSPLSDSAMSDAASVDSVWGPNDPLDDGAASETRRTAGSEALRRGWMPPAADLGGVPIADLLGRRTAGLLLSLFQAGRGRGSFTLPWTSRTGTRAPHVLLVSPHGATAQTVPASCCTAPNVVLTFIPAVAAAHEDGLIVASAKAPVMYRCKCCARVRASPDVDWRALRGARRIRGRDARYTEEEVEEDDAGSGPAMVARYHDAGTLFGHLFASGITTTFHVACATVCPFCRPEVIRPISSGPPSTAVATVVVLVSERDALAVVRKSVSAKGMLCIAARDCAQAVGLFANSRPRPVAAVVGAVVTGGTFATFLAAARGQCGGAGASRDHLESTLTTQSSGYLPRRPSAATTNHTAADSGSAASHREGGCADDLARPVIVVGPLTTSADAIRAGASSYIAFPTTSVEAKVCLDECF